MAFTNFNNLFVITIFGGLILLAFINATNPLKINARGNKWLSVFLLLLSTFWLEEIAKFTGFGEINKNLSTFIHSIQIFTPSSLYAAVLFYTNPNLKIRPSHWKHLLIPMVFIAIEINKIPNTSNQSLLNTTGTIIILFQALLYCILAFIKIRKHQKQILLYSSNTQDINLNWLEYIIIQILTLTIIVLFYNIFFNGQAPNILLNSIQLITVFIIAHFSLKQKEIFPSQKENLIMANSPHGKIQERKKLLADDELQSIMRKLRNIMINEQPHLDSDLNLVKLAKQLSITPHQLSYTINSGFDENFFQFVNRHRVEKAKELLRNSDKKITMIAIAFDSGFNSKTSFNTTFKRMTGQTPSEYKEKCSDI
ncbi:AraC family transcriptional regulator [Marinilabilia sp.]|uniref:helix-turn-helix domain-containing protein n=1 Tax=Marinilabilia sp. TaxID=2021252 RepID=UPI0025C45C86|nr:helix-turn-helix domain-containing protein [Marinilabilia sp.]